MEKGPAGDGGRGASHGMIPGIRGMDISNEWYHSAPVILSIKPNHDNKALAKQKTIQLNRLNHLPRAYSISIHNYEPLPGNLARRS